MCLLFVCRERRFNNRNRFKIKSRWGGIALSLLIAQLFSCDLFNFLFFASRQVCFIALFLYGILYTWLRVVVSFSMLPLYSTSALDFSFRVLPQEDAPTVP